MDFSQATAHAIKSMGHFLPELVLAGTMLLVIVADLFAGRGRALKGGESGGSLPGWVAFAGLVLSAVLAWGQMSQTPELIFFGMLQVDSLAAFLKVLFALSTALVVLISFRIRHQGELHALLLAAVLGMDLLAGSRNFLMVMVALETVSIMSYVLAGFDRRDTRSGEAALKYMIFGSMASGAMLFGVSWLYGLTGTLDLDVIHGALRMGAPDSLALLLAVLLVMAGIGYKIAMVPVHFWCPDVYDGAPTPVTTFFSVGPKAAGIALLIRFLYPDMEAGALETGLAAAKFNPLILVAWLAGFTMTLGNLAAIGQTRVKRLLAYSSIAHAGYLMTGLVLAQGAGISAVMFYLVVYFLMNYGAFFVVDAVGLTTGDESLDSFKGLGKSNTWLAVSMTVFLVSLVGLPPLAGFIGKFVLFGQVVKEGWYTLVTVAVLNSVVSLYYYFSIVKAMWFDQREGEEPATVSISMHTGIVSVLCVLTVIFGIFYGPLTSLADMTLMRLL